MATSNDPSFGPFTGSPSTTFTGSAVPDNNSNTGFGFISTNEADNAKPNWNIPQPSVNIASMADVPIGASGIYPRDVFADPNPITINGVTITYGGDMLARMLGVTIPSRAGAPRGSTPTASPTGSSAPGTGAAGLGSGGGCALPASQSPYSASMNLQNSVSGSGGDPTYDEYTENIAGGNNTSGTRGTQVPNTNTETPPTQTTLPPEITDQAGTTNITPAKGGDGVVAGCYYWDGKSYDLQLSPHFTLNDFTLGAFWPHPLTLEPVAGVDCQTRCCNLQNVAMNIAEPMYSQFGSISINSGLRNTSSSRGISQHVLGQAVDIQIPGWSYEMYWNAAAWIKDNINFDQFIFEHSSTTGLAWFHLSYNRAGNRPNGPSKVMTMYRNCFSTGLHKFD